MNCLTCMDWRCTCISVVNSPWRQWTDFIFSITGTNFVDFWIKCDSLSMLNFVTTVLTTPSQCCQLTTIENSGPMQNFTSLINLVNKIVNKTEITPSASDKRGYRIGKQEKLWCSSHSEWHTQDSERQTVFYLANGTKVLCIISMLLYKTLCTCALPDAVLRQGFYFYRIFRKCNCSQSF